MGVGGGVILIPAMVYTLRMDQRMAQGTSLFMQLPLLGLGALLLYRKKGQVDLKEGVICALGILAGGYFGSKMAIGISSRDLREMFGLLTMVVAIGCLGLRVCELLGLQWGDVDFENLTVKVQRSFVEGELYPTKTETSESELPLDPDLGAMLLNHRARSTYSAA